MGFFEYYSEFDFDQFGISLIEGKRVAKPTSFADAAIYIENPLERDLNVAKNVQDVYIEQFQSECRVALNALSSGDSRSLLSILTVDDNDNDSGNSDDTIDKDSESSDDDRSDGTVVVKSRPNQLNFNELFNSEDVK